MAVDDLLVFLLICIDPWLQDVTNQFLLYGSWRLFMIISVTWVCQCQSDPSEFPFIQMDLDGFGWIRAGGSRIPQTY